MRDLGFDLVLEQVSRIGRETVAPNAELVNQGNWPESGLRTLQGDGLGGLVVPRAYGGHGFGLLELVRVCEVLGESCASTAMCYAMHCVGSAVLSAKATAAHRPYLEAIAAGTHLTTLSLSEPGTGAHFWYPQTRLTTVSDHELRVDGHKAFTTNGGYADSYVLSTVAADLDASPSQFSCVLVPADTPGMTWGTPWHGMGMRGNSSRSLELRDVRIERSNILGEEGDQIWYVFNVVAPYFLMAMCGVYLGVAGAAFEEARGHLKRRCFDHDGTNLSEVPVVQHRLGALWSRIESTRRLIYHAAQSADEGGPEALAALSCAKAEVAECVTYATNEALSLCGGIGYREGGKLERLLRDGRAAHVMSPTTDILLLWAGRALLGESILGD